MFYFYHLLTTQQQAANQQIKCQTKLSVNNSNSLIRKQIKNHHPHPVSCSAGTVPSFRWQYHWLLSFTSHTAPKFLFGCCLRLKNVVCCHSLTCFLSFTSYRHSHLSLGVLPFFCIGPSFKLLQKIFQTTSQGLFVSLQKKVQADTLWC